MSQYAVRTDEYGKPVSDRQHHAKVLASYARMGNELSRLCRITHSAQTAFLTDRDWTWEQIRAWSKQQQQELQQLWETVKDFYMMQAEADDRDLPLPEGI